MKRRLLALILALAMVLAFAACASSTATKDADKKDAETSTTAPSTDAPAADDAAKDETPAAEEPEKKVYHLGMSIDTTNQAWRAGLAENVTTAAAKYDNVELTVTDAGGSVEKQISDVEDLISKGVDAILISPADSQGLTSVCADAYNAGIPVIVLDRELKGEEWTCFIGANNWNIGVDVGNYLVEMMTEKGLTNLVIIAGSAGDSPAYDRTQPVYDAIEGTGISVIAEQPADWMQPNALEVMENLLQADIGKNEIQVVYAECDSMALGCLQAIEEAGRDDIIVVSIDGQKEAFQAIIAGTMNACFTYPFPGELGVETAIKIIDGETVDRVIDMDSTKVDASNVNDLYNPDSVF